MVSIVRPQGLELKNLSQKIHAGRIGVVFFESKNRWHGPSFIPMSKNVGCLLH